MTEWQLSTSHLNRLTASVIIAIVAYLLTSLWSGWQQVITAIQAVGWNGVAVVLSFSLVNYGLRFIRWQIFLTEFGYVVPYRPSFLIYLAGFSLTTTPGKAGELLRGVFLKSYGLSFTHSTAAFLSERLSDLFAIVLLCILSIATAPYGSSVITIGIIIVLSLQLALSSQNLLKKMSGYFSNDQRKSAIALKHLFQMLIEARRCHTLKMQVTTLTLSMMAWFAEVYALYLILQWMNMDSSLLFATAVYTLSMLAGAISLTPGGLGSTEVVMIGLLIWDGLGEAEAVAAAVLIRLATLWFAVALGGMVLLIGKNSLTPA